MAGQRLGIGVVGAGRWASLAHLPGWARDERCRIVGVCDLDPERAAAAAGRYGAAVTTGDYRVLLDRDDIDIIDVVTRDGEHFPINRAAVEAGKHVLSEKPVAHDHHDVRQIAELARAKGLKTKVGFTFRYSPAVRYLKDLITRGDLGTPFIYNAYEQNSQWLNPQTAAPQPGAGHRRPDQGGLARGLRRPGDRHRPLVHGVRPHRGRRRAAQLRPGADDRRDRGNGAHQHRRRRHLHRRVRQRRHLLGAEQLRHRRQLPRHRGPRLRQRGRGHRPADRGIRHLRDAQGRHAR